MDNLLEQAAESPCLRMDHDLRTSSEDSSQRMLNAGEDIQGLCIPVGQWHTINVIEPTVILECKGGKYEPLSADDMIDI